MKRMKKNIISLVLLVGLLVLGACETSPGPLGTLEGEWEISTFHFGTHNVISENRAQEWVGKKAHFKKDQITFEYIKIPSYRKLFSRDSICQLKEVNISKMNSKEYMLTGYKTPPAQVGINSESVQILKTNCAGTPFSQFIQLNDSRLLINWDGVFFLLKRI